MIKIYSNENVILVNHIKNLLDNSGISSFVKNENMQNYGVGVGSISWPELWLHNAEREKKATALIKQNAKTESQASENWKCTSCSEINEPQFNICWKCNQSANTAH
jgi:hypothetical protein